MCVAYMSLASDAAAAGERLWILRPKFHEPRRMWNSSVQLHVFFNFFNFKLSIVKASQ